MPSSECPTCGEEFKNEHGVKIHHARAHGESIAGVSVECAWCGDEFQVDTAEANAHNWHTCTDECNSKYRSENYKRENNPNSGKWYTVECDHCGSEYDVPEHRKGRSRFCSTDCYYSWMSENQSGEKSHAWEGGLEVLDCAFCGDEYSVYPARKDESRFCSYKCLGKARSVENTGSNNPSWKGGNVVLECEYCGDEYETYPSKRDSSRFCSYDCLDLWRAENMTGQDSPSWRGGGRTREAVKKQLHGRSWRTIREQSLGDSCVICDQRSDLCLHHIVPLMDGGTNGEWNLMTLCRTCHTRTEHYTRQFSNVVLVGQYRP
ncbi:HNH endonuclease [Natronorubrum halophilum]|uniref:HNH endonuclease n=1 Tax=Natronorubrum halophilum TaxID=1702106 RepID=UPI000EF6A05B